MNSPLETTTKPTETLQEDGATEITCCDERSEDELESYVCGLLSANDEEQLECHVLICASCIARLSVIEEYVRSIRFGCAARRNGLLNKHPRRSR